MTENRPESKNRAVFGWS